MDDLVQTGKDGSTTFSIMTLCKASTFLKLIGIMLGVVVLVIVKLDVMMLSAIVLRRTSQIACRLGNN